MKLLTVLALCLVLSLSSAFPRKNKKEDYERRRVIHRETAKKEHKHEVRHDAKSKVTKHHGSKKGDHKVYKKFGMFAAPTFALEDSSAPQVQPALQQVLVPVNSASFAQNTVAAPEMVSSFTSTPTQRATLGTEVVGDQSDTQQPVTMQTVQAQQPQTVQIAGAPMAAKEDNSMLKTTTQGVTLQQETGAAQPEMLESPAGSLGAGSESIQSFTQQDPGKDSDEMKDLQVYNGPLPDNGQKPQIEGVSPQEEVKVVNLGDDEKTASLQQDKQCRGCPPAAKCVNGQCQIREEDAQAAGLTGKGTANNPGSLSDVRDLETQELTSLLKDASKADTPPTAVPESPTGSTLTSEFSSQGQGESQLQGSAQPKIQTGQQTDLEKPASLQDGQQLTTEAKRPETFAKPIPTFAQPQFTSDQLKELRDFARMYKMYQFIRKMEERLNDPDCAPVCRRKCKTFCPAKCCRGQKVNTNVVSHLMQTADKIKGIGNQAPLKPPKAPKKLTQAPKQITGMDDNGIGDNEEEEERKMDKETAGKKHILIRIVKNGELDKPRANINH